MAEFHFLRPWWLVAAPLGVWLLWRVLRRASAGGRWALVVDRALQPYVLAALPALERTRRWPLLAATAGWIVAAFALAGPTWERQAVPAVRAGDALVAVLDLSRSMDASDVNPSRLARAKLKLLGMLDRRGDGQTGLVVFSAHAFTVSPLTTDNGTIAALIGSLSSDIMPSRGSYPEAGLTKAAQLLRQAGLPQGDIVLITDARGSERSIDVARELGREGFRTHVLAIGTEQGGPIGDADGGFVTDRSGRVVIATLEPAGLRRLADAGRGEFVLATPDDADIDALLSATGGLLPRTADEGGDFRVDVWRDQGPWLVVLLLPLAALAFRRGWIAVCLLGALLPLRPADAFEWADLWQRPDQRGQAAMQAGEPERAAELFEQPEWRAAAEYRSGEYAASAATLAGVETTEGHYNRGNALAMDGRFEAAIAAYERALALEPEHEDARHNLELLKQAQSARQSAQRAADPQGDPQDGDPQQQRQDDAAGSDAERRAAADADAADGPPQHAEQTSGGEPAEDQAGEAEEARLAEARQAGEQGPPAYDREGLEQWAAEQAAEQWLRRVPQDPGGLLRRKFRYQYQRLGIDQDGNYVWPGDEAQPW